MSSTIGRRLTGAILRFAANARRRFSLNPSSGMEVKPRFTLTFEPATPMDEIQDHVIELVLEYTNGNRKRAGELLRINPATIRRRLGKKSESRGTISSVTRYEPSVPRLLGQLQ